MKASEVYNAVINALNDFAHGQSMEDTATTILNTMRQAQEPYKQSADHLKLFIVRVKEMRDMQISYFKGNKKVIVMSKQLEQKVDIAINKLSGDLGYTPAEIAKEVEQIKLF